MLCAWRKIHNSVKGQGERPCNERCQCLQVYLIEEVVDVRAVYHTLKPVTGKM